MASEYTFRPAASPSSLSPSLTIADARTIASSHPQQLHHCPSKSSTGLSREAVQHHTWPLLATPPELAPLAIVHLTIALGRSAPCN